MKRKVLVVLPEMETGGGQRMALSTVSHIKTTDLKMRILVLYPRRGDILEQYADENQLDIQYLHKTSGFDFKCIFEIYRAIKDYQPNVIHAHLRVMPYLLLPMCLAGMQRRYYTVHNLADKDAEGFKRHILRFAFRHCHVHPVAISALCRKSITEEYGIPEDIIPCIYVGIDVDRFTCTSRYHHDAPFRFVAVGRLSDQKNYPMMLQSFSELRRHITNTELMIVGDGELRDALKQQCNDLGIDGAVSFTGNVPDVESYLWKADAYLMSSDYEGLPQTVLEAMAAGLPIISTKAGGVVDVVEHEKNGLLVDCGDQEGLTHAMKCLIQSPELCKQFSECSVALAQKYSIAACAEQYKELYLA